MELCARSWETVGGGQQSRHEGHGFWERTGGRGERSEWAREMGNDLSPLAHSPLTCPPGYTGALALAWPPLVPPALPPLCLLAGRSMPRCWEPEGRGAFQLLLLFPQPAQGPLPAAATALGMHSSLLSAKSPMSSHKGSGKAASLTLLHFAGHALLPSSVPPHLFSSSLPQPLCLYQAS